MGHSGWLSGNRLRDFPLADGQPVPVDDDVRTALFGCIVDAMVSVSSPDDARSPRICNIGSDGTTFRVSVAMGQDFTPVSVSWSAAGQSEYPVVSGKTSWGFYTIVFSSEGIRDLGPLDLVFPSSAALVSSSAEEGLYFSPKAVNRASDGVSSIRVFDGVRPKEDGPHFVLGGDVLIRPGNNMTLGRYPDEGDEGGVEISAVPGAGMGVVPCRCSSAGVVSSGLKSEDGHVRLFNDTCYDLEPSTSSGVLKIHAKCTACCTCDMYSSIVDDRLAVLSDSIRKARRDIQDALSVYEENVRAFNRRIASPEEEDIVVTMSGSALGKNMATKTNSIAGSLDRASFRALVVNNAFVDVVITVTGMQSSGVIKDSTLNLGAARSVHGGGSLVDQSFVLSPGGCAAIAFVAVGRQLSTRAGASFTGSVSFSAEFRGNVFGTYTRSVTAS